MHVPPVLRPAPRGILRESEIALRPAWTRLHPQLPPTLMWGYDGQVPGPTVEVRRGQRVRITWTDRHPNDHQALPWRHRDHAMNGAHKGHGEGRTD